MRGEKFIVRQFKDQHINFGDNSLKNCKCEKESFNLDGEKYEMDSAFITTSFSFEGYKITKHYGIVRGIIVRSRSILGNIGAGFQALVGGNITLYTQMCEKARVDAFQEMIAHAEKSGANAIIGMRYDANEISQGITEVLAYGTAVFIENE
jgi:uncharacterized protein YbjQ (UPF0145 family)